MRRTSSRTCRHRCLIAILAGLRVENDADTELLHLGDNTFGQALVGRVVVGHQERDFNILATVDVCREVDDPVAIRVLQTCSRQFLLRTFKVEGIVHGRLPVIEVRTRQDAARIGRHERTLDEGIAEFLPVDRHGDGLAEVLVAVQLTNRLRPCIRIAPAIGREVHVDVIADEARAKGETGRRILLRSALQRFDEVFRCSRFEKSPEPATA